MSHGLEPFAKQNKPSPLGQCWDACFGGRKACWSRILRARLVSAAGFEPATHALKEKLTLLLPRIFNGLQVTQRYKRYKKLNQSARMASTLASTFARCLPAPFAGD